MKRKLTQPWNMASVRSRQAPRVRKVHGPISGMALHPPELLGRQLRWGGGMDALVDPQDYACQGCGHHVCSCAPVPPSPGPTWPLSAFAIALDANIKNLMESASIHRECDQLGVACVCEACKPA